MGRRLTVLTAYMTIVLVPVRAADQGRVSEIVKAALEFFQGHGDLSLDEFLERERPLPIDEIQRDRVMAALPQGVIKPDPQSLAKMSLGHDVLAYHRRRGLITFAIIKVRPAFIGLHGRAVILVSANILPLLNKEEFAALVAHEIGHEYVWSEYRRAQERHDHARIRELELRCDGIAVLTLRRLGLDPARLVRAVQVLTWYNKELGLDENADDYVSSAERRAFITAVAKLEWAERYPANHPTIAESLIGPGILTTVPAALRNTTFVNVTVARRSAGLLARTPGGDNSIETVPPIARQTSGPIASGIGAILTSEQKSKLR